MISGLADFSEEFFRELSRDKIHSTMKAIVRVPGAQEIAEDLFYKSLQILNDKYLVKGKCETEVDVRKVISGIIRHEIQRYRMSLVDEIWYKNLSEEDRELSWEPPSRAILRRLSREESRTPRGRARRREYMKQYWKLHRKKRTPEQLRMWRERRKQIKKEKMLGVFRDRRIKYPEELLESQGIKTA